MKKAVICLATLATLSLMVFLSGCGGFSPTVFLHEEYNFQYLERIAVVPFENLTGDQGIGARTTRIFTTELLAAKAFEVVEPGEVNKVLEKYSVVRTGKLTAEQIKGIGLDLKVQGIIMGSVTESSALRSGGTTVNIISMSTYMVETETGATIWSATNSSGKKGFLATIFGTGDKTQSEAIRECVRGALNTLID